MQRIVKLFDGNIVDLNVVSAILLKPYTIKEARPGYNAPVLVFVLSEGPHVSVVYDASHYHKGNDKVGAMELAEADARKDRDLYHALLVDELGLEWSVLTGYESLFKIDHPLGVRVVYHDGFWHLRLFTSMQDGQGVAVTQPVKPPMLGMQPGRKPDHEGWFWLFGSPL